MEKQSGGYISFWMRFVYIGQIWIWNLMRLFFNGYIDQLFGQITEVGSTIAAPVASVVPNHQTDAVHSEVLGAGDPPPERRWAEKKPLGVQGWKWFEHQGIYWYTFSFVCVCSLKSCVLYVPSNLCSKSYNYLPLLSLVKAA